MESYLPFFPLNIVVYPGEHLNLHIFEERYKALVNHCKSCDSTFGIPAYIDDRMRGYGTEVSLVEISKLYTDGRMDIKTQGLRVFKILNFDNPMKDKLYCGGEIEFIEIQGLEEEGFAFKLIDMVKVLFDVLKMEINIPSSKYKFLSYEVAHKVGLTMNQEYELLCIENEIDRQLYIYQHLQQTIPVVKEMERLKERIQLNGHFKHFDPLRF